MAEFVISDTHFGHGNIIELGKRPFENNEHMTNTLIKNWNETVTERDTVYHLGDFGWKNAEYNLDVLARLRFKKLVLVCGNHDTAKTLNAFHTLGVQVQDYYEIPLPYTRLRCCLFHYPMAEWNGYYRGAVHLHGHTHSAVYSDMPGRYNVCAEAVGYRPKSLAQIEKEHLELMEHLKGNPNAQDHDHPRTQ